MIVQVYAYGESFESLGARNVSLVYFNTTTNVWESQSGTLVADYIEFDTTGKPDAFVVIEGNPGQNDVVRKISPIVKVYG